MANLSSNKQVQWNETGQVEDINQDGQQTKIDELVERFYVRLIQDPYYSKMFAERKVDIELLKSRQKVFILRLANGEALHEEHGAVGQVRERHSFGVNPDRAKVWLQKLTETMEEMDFSSDIKDPLLEKIHFLISKMVQK